MLNKTLKTFTNSACRLGLVIALGTTLGCGWQLRGLQQVGQTPSELELQAEGQFSPIAEAMRTALHEHTVNLAKQAQWRLQLGQEKLTKRTVAVTSIGSASQYELSLSVPFLYINKAQGAKGLPITLSTSRTFDYDPRNSTAKTEEENLLLDEMRKELAVRILQQFLVAHGQN